jgi:hypothetical protein
MRMDEFWAVSRCSLVEVSVSQVPATSITKAITGLMMEAVNISETLVNAIRPHGAKTQKKAIFSEVFIRIIFIE